jgi:hypothetical protein
VPDLEKINKKTLKKGPDLESTAKAPLLEERVACGRK